MSCRVWLGHGVEAFDLCVYRGKAERLGRALHASKWLQYAVRDEHIDRRGFARYKAATSVDVRRVFSLYHFV